MLKLWHDLAWEEYLEWQRTDRAMVKRINQLIKDIERDPFRGIGKPEPLKGNLAGCWSRRIDETHRLVYCIEDGKLILMQCAGHYDDK